MKLPNLSHMMNVGQLRYIQSIYETGGIPESCYVCSRLSSNPAAVGCMLRGKLLLGELPSNPLYYYIVARTKHYDEAFVDAICNKVKYIINVGCGSDTRAYRFGHVLKQKGIRVLECDQSEAIYTKQQIAQRKWPTDHVEYHSIDLNSNSWSDFEHWLSQNNNASVQVLMEGVSPYVNEESFGRFLAFLAGKLRAGSRVAYDFKLRGVSDDLGRSYRTQSLFRLPAAREEVLTYHKAQGHQLEHLELRSDLSVRFLSDLAKSTAPLFGEDRLVRLLVPPK